MGGETKLQHIRAADPPVKLHPVKLNRSGAEGESKLSVLIHSLYRLLQAHYQATNFEDLERFKAEPLRGTIEHGTPATTHSVVDDEAESETQIPPYSLGIQYKRAQEMDAEASDVEEAVLASAAVERDLERSEEGAAAPSDPEPKTSTTTFDAAPKDLGNTKEKATRVLDTHHAVMRAFERAFKEVWGTKDKHYDQFDGLGTMIDAPDQRPSSGSGSKRAAETPLDLLRAQYAKRLKENSFYVALEPLKGAQPLELAPRSSSESPDVVPQ